MITVCKGPLSRAWLDALVGAIHGCKSQDNRYHTVKEDHATALGYRRLVCAVRLGALSTNSHAYVARQHRRVGILRRGRQAAVVEKWTLDNAFYCNNLSWGSDTLTQPHTLAISTRAETFTVGSRYTFQNIDMYIHRGRIPFHMLWSTEPSGQKVRPAASLNAVYPILGTPTRRHPNLQLDWKLWIGQGRAVDTSRCCALTD